MKWFLILLALGLAASEKLDRTYLPPPGAKFSGGSPGAIQTPLELPKETYQTPGTLITDNGLPTLGDSRIELGISRGQPQFGQVTTTKSPFTYYTENLPTTTTSYAFSQTTTLPPVETYGATVRPISSTTGLPVQYSSQNLGNPGFPTRTQDGYSYKVQSQRPSFQSVVNNNQPGIEGQIGSGQPSYNQDNQLLGQYQDQYPITVIPGGNIKTGPVYQLPNQKGYQYPNTQNIGQVFTPSTATPQVTNGFAEESQNSNFGSNAAPVSSINPQPTYDQTQYQQSIPSKYSENQNSMAIRGNSQGQTGTSSPEYFNQPSFSSTTPLSSVSSTVLPTFGSFVRPERPQAEADRNAVIINFENKRTPNGYSYSYDTSNGIHADESGVIDNGTKAKGGYSYIGDDGKIYSVTYTADENGFQPRGDHLPTPPPIPEAIQKVIEQAARDNQAGISDDGSYNEEKYGDKKYQGKLNRYLSNQFNNVESSQNNRGKPISSLGNSLNEQNNGAQPNQFSNDINVNENSRGLAKVPSKGNSGPANKITQTDASMSGIENTRSLVGYEPNTEGISTRLDQQRTKLNYPETQAGNVEPLKYSEYDTNKTPVVISSDFRSNDDSKFSNGLGAIPSTGSNNISDRPQTFGEDNQRRESFQRPVASNIRYTKTKNAPRKSFAQGSKIDSNVQQADAKQPTTNQRTGGIKHNNDGNNKGYTYNRPQTKFEQNRFPTRFRGQESSVRPEENNANQGTTLKPFMTPNVYNKVDRTPLSFARKPFEVILPTTESYNDYTDENDYPTKYQSIVERLGSTKLPAGETSATVRPDQSKQSTTPYQYAPVNQGTDITQSIGPEVKTTEYSIAVTTPKPLQSSRSGASSTGKSVTQYKTGPNIGYVGNNPSTKAPAKSGFISRSEGPVGYSATKLVPDSSAVSNGFDSRLPTANRVTPQSSSTTTFKPINYSRKTVQPGFDLSTAPVAPFAYQMGYQYGNSEPISSYGNVATSRPVLISSGPGMYSEVAPGSTYQYGPVTDYSQSTIGPVNLRSGSIFQTGTPQASSPVSYQTGYQYGPGLPATTGITSPGSSSSGAVTTPQSYSSSTYRPGFIEGYTQRPITVDNFGRPINSEATYYPEYSFIQNSGLPSYADTNKVQNPVSNKANVAEPTDSTGIFPYPGYGTTERVIGEDFSGPKQPQKFDAKTGYHY